MYKSKSGNKNKNIQLKIPTAHYIRETSAIIEYLQKNGQLNNPRVVSLRNSFCQPVSLLAFVTVSADIKIAFINI